MNIVDDLKERKILYDITDSKKVLSLKGKGVYIGFDPTASSLHLGNFIQIMNLLRFKKYGYKPFAVLGGATAMIGDPSGKSSERNLLSEEQVQINKKKIKEQLSFYKIDVVDNYDFYKDMNSLYFLRHVGKLLNVNYMISKDVVKSRLESGISFTEFSYQLIQG
jgi:tyrosyl-tRNA synthetase